MLGPEDRLFFIHIPKTAGTSLIPLIDARFAQDEICPAQLWREFVKIPQDKIPNYRLFRGHYGAHGLDPFLPKPPVTMTMLREPLKLAYSTYQFVLREPNTRIHKLVKSEKMDFADFVAHPKTRARISNKMARNLSFHLEHDPDSGPIFLSRSSQAVVDQWIRDHGVRPTGPERFQRAMNQLEQCAFFGLVEQFDASMALMTWTFDWCPLGQTEKHRISKKRLDLDALPSDCVDQLKKANESDIELYDRGTQLFETKLGEMLDDLKQYADHPDQVPTRYDDDPDTVHRLLDVRYRARRLEHEGTPAERIRIRFSDPLPGSGWHGREFAPADQDWFRWTGPTTQATLDLNLDRSRPQCITFRTLNAIDRETLDGLKLLVDDQEVPLRIKDGERSLVRVLQADIPPADDPEPTLTRLTLEVSATDSKHNRSKWDPDTRRVGIAVQWVDVTPLELVAPDGLPDGFVEVSSSARIMGHVAAAKQRLKKQIKHTPVLGPVLSRVAHKMRTG